MLRITSRGNFSKTKDHFQKLLRHDQYSELDRFGRLGVEALSRATPIDTGETKESWGYRIFKDRRSITIEWYNTNSANGTPIAILVQYGHGTGTGGYVQGRDFINPAIQPIFDQIADDVWKKVRA